MARDIQNVGLKHLGAFGMKWLIPLWIGLPVLLLFLVAATFEYMQWTAAERNLARLRSLYEGPAENWPRATIDEGVAYLELSRPDTPTIAEMETPMVLLGQRLFEDPALSASGHFACQSCHNRRLGWGNGLPRAFGHGRQEGRRNAQSLFTATASSSFFWDGRAASLEMQMLGPLTAGDEMANDDLGAVVDRVAMDRDYDEMVLAAFGSPGLDLDRIATALAEFQRSLDRPTRFDYFLAGRHTALSDEAIWGLHLFRTKGRCANCHMGPYLTDNQFHNIGLSYYNRKYEDVGRYEVTKNPSDTGRFRTPSLRHLARTGPYMHNGLFPTIRGLVNLYAFGGGRSARDLKNDDPLYPHAAKSSDLIKPLDLSDAERRALVAFLETL